ncbi:MAG: LCP family protein, partial [Dethiobacteria bacterium]|nr:LCP family protein [Dethiobacteria bacterium]
MAEFSPRARLYISLGLIGAIILVSFSIIFYGVYQVYFAPASLFSRDFDDAMCVDELFDERLINVVVLGLHNRNDDNTYGDVYNVDTILVATINFDQNTLSLLAVPRDSYVQIAAGGVQDRIRQSYSYGYNLSSATERHEAGLRSAIDTVSELLDGLTLHYYIAMDIQGLKQLIDSLGGVFYTVEEQMIGYTAQESLDAGPQLLDGQGYLTYLTYREPDSRDDLNRIKRQKALLLATFKYFQDMGLFSYVIPTYATYREHIHTDLSFNQVTALTLFAGERLEAGSIFDYSLQGEYFSTDNGATYYLALDE